jgi:hypothetical protein
VEAAVSSIQSALDTFTQAILTYCHVRWGLVRRRQFILFGLVSLAASALPVQRVRAAAISRVRPGMPGWPTEADWAALNQATNARLLRVTAPALGGSEAKRLLANPFFIGDQPGLTQSSGWLDAWRSSLSAYVVAAENARDVAAAVRFASTHNLRLVVRDDAWL